MKVCGQHLQRLHAGSFNSMCAYMCCGGHVDPSVCWSLLIYMRISPAFLLCRYTGLLCRDTWFVCGDRGLFIHGAFATGAVFLKNESTKRPQTCTVLSAVFGATCVEVWQHAGSIRTDCMWYTHLYTCIYLLSMQLYVWIVDKCILACGCMSTLCFFCAHIEGSCADILSCTDIVDTIIYVKVNSGYISYVLFVLLLFRNIETLN